MFHVEHRKFPVIREIALQFDRRSENRLAAFSFF